MKIDTSSYYPKSNLDDDDEKVEVAAETTSVLGPETSAPVDVTDHAGEAAQPDTKAPLELTDDSYMEQPPTEGERWMDRIATMLSWVFVPLLMPVYGVLLGFNLSILMYAPGGSKLVYVLLTALFNVGIPAILVILLKSMGLVDDLGLNGRKERTIPYIITICCMMATAWFFSRKGAPMWLAMFFVGGAVAGLVNLIINLKWKISAHAAGVAGIVALLLRLLHIGFPAPGLEVWLMIAIGISGLLGASRIWLGRHTLGQVLAGYAVGFCSVFFLTMINI